MKSGTYGRCSLRRLLASVDRHAAAGWAAILTIWGLWLLAKHWGVQ
jgi:hypothetical protein